MLGRLLTTATAVTKAARFHLVLVYGSDLVTSPASALEGTTPRERERSATGCAILSLEPDEDGAVARGPLSTNLRRQKGSSSWYFRDLQFHTLAGARHSRPRQDAQVAVARGVHPEYRVRIFSLGEREGETGVWAEGYDGACAGEQPWDTCSSALEPSPKSESDTGKRPGVASLETKRKIDTVCWGAGRTRRSASATSCEIR